MHLRKPSPTSIIASLALFIALGGTAIAAHHYLITSTSQIKPSVLKKLKGNAGRTGAAGAAGAQGAQGPAGPSNLSALTIVRAPNIKVPSGEMAESVATCPAGSHVVSGGSYTGFAVHADSEMSGDHQSWLVLVFNESGINTNLQAMAYCGGAGQAVAASVPRAAHARAVRQAQALMARLIEERQARGLGH